MQRRTILIAAIPCMMASVAGSSAADPADPVEYKIDGAHSAVMFKTMLADIGYYYGRFHDVKGAFLVVDGDHPAIVGLKIEVNAASIDCGGTNERALKSKNYFNTEKFPKMTFATRDVKKLTDREFELTGDLAFHGQTRPLTVVFTVTGSHRKEFTSGPNKGAFTGLFAGETTFDFKMSDFGLDTSAADDVTIIASIWGRREIRARGEK